VKCSSMREAISGLIMTPMKLFPLPKVYIDFIRKKDHLIPFFSHSTPELSTNFLDGIAVGHFHSSKERLLDIEDGAEISVALIAELRGEKIPSNCTTLLSCKKAVREFYFKKLETIQENLRDCGKQMLAIRPARIARKKQENVLRPPSMDTAEPNFELDSTKKFVDLVEIRKPYKRFAELKMECDKYLKLMHITAELDPLLY